MKLQELFENDNQEMVKKVKDSEITNIFKAILPNGWHIIDSDDIKSAKTIDAFSISFGCIGNGSQRLGGSLENYYGDPTYNDITISQNKDGTFNIGTFTIDLYINVDNHSTKKTIERIQSVENISKEEMLKRLSKAIRIFKTIVKKNQDKILDSEKFKKYFE